MRTANIMQLGVKELRGLLRDPMLLVLIVYAFTVSIYTASRAQPETLNRAALAIIDEDKSPASARIIAAFNPPYFTIPRLISQAEMDSRMDAGLDTFALNIPPGFQRDLLAQRSPTIQLNVDATRMSQAFTGGGYIESIVTDEVGEFLARYRSAAAFPIDLALRARFNPELNKSWFGAINNVISSITMLSIILTGAALIREREHGTIEHLLVMPVTPFEIMASKIWSMGSGRSSRLQRVTGVRRAGNTVGPDRWLNHALPIWYGTLPLRHDQHGHLSGDGWRDHAAVRPADDTCTSAASDVVGKHDSAREHAGYHPKYYALRP
jgi:ABC-2 type transport system permease protein